MECPREFQENGVRPTKETFDKYLTFFLNDLPDENCAKAGKASYGNVSISSYIPFSFLNYLIYFFQGIKLYIRCKW